LFCNDILIHNPLAQGEIARKKNIIPKRIFICALIISILLETLIILTPNIITGILKIIIISPPIEKFLLFNKFIDPDIADIQVIITDPIKKLKYTIFKLSNCISNKRNAIGRIIKKGA